MDNIIDNVVTTFSDPPAIGDSFKVSNSSDNCTIFIAEWTAILCQYSNADIIKYIIEATDTKVRDTLQSKLVESLSFFCLLATCFTSFYNDSKDTVTPV